MDLESQFCRATLKNHATTLYKISKKMAFVGAFSTNSTKY